MKKAVTLFKKSLPSQPCELLVITRPGFFFGEPDIIAIIQRDGQNPKKLNYLCPSPDNPWEDFEAARIRQPLPVDEMWTRLVELFDGRITELKFERTEEGAALVLFDRQKEWERGTAAAGPHQLTR